MVTAYLIAVLDTRTITPVVRDVKISSEPPNLDNHGINKAEVLVMVKESETFERAVHDIHLETAVNHQWAMYWIDEPRTIDAKEDKREYIQMIHEAIERDGIPPAPPPSKGIA